MYLITLIGQGEIEIKIVDQPTWIRLSENNDKMLELENSECIKTFDNNLVDLIKWSNDNNITIIDSYYGYIY